MQLYVHAPLIIKQCTLLPDSPACYVLQHLACRTCAVCSINPFFLTITDRRELKLIVPFDESHPGVAAAALDLHHWVGSSGGGIPQPATYDQQQQQTQVPRSSLTAGAATTAAMLASYSALTGTPALLPSIAPAAGQPQNHGGVRPEAANPTVGVLGSLAAGQASSSGLRTQARLLDGWLDAQMAKVQEAVAYAASQTPYTRPDALNYLTGMPPDGGAAAQQGTQPAAEPGGPRVRFDMSVGRPSSAGHRVPSLAGKGFAGFPEAEAAKSPHPASEHISRLQQESVQEAYEHIMQARTDERPAARYIRISTQDRNDVFSSTQKCRMQIKSLV